MSPEWPETARRAARHGRLVVFLTTALEVRPNWPAGVWLATDHRHLPGPGRVLSDADLEGGAVRRIEAGDLVEVASPEAWGTPRRPTRLREWYEDLLRRRTVVVIGDPPPGLPPGALRLDGPPPELPEVRRALPPPPLPGVSSRPSLLALAWLAFLALLGWSSLYAHFRAAQNASLWIQLIPWGLAAGLLAAGLAPLAARASAGLDLPARECYARALARWSRRPRAPVAGAVLFTLALYPLWFLARHGRATFVILYEPAIVSVEGQPPLGACRAEDPCTFLVPRPSHLHFEGAEGGVCGLDFTGPSAVLFIDTEQDACEPFVSDEKPPPPRG